MHAAAKGHVGVLWELLAAGAEKDLQDKVRNTLVLRCPPRGV
jgi:hypothetical protein